MKVSHLIIEAGILATLLISSSSAETIFKAKLDSTESTYTVKQVRDLYLQVLNSQGKLIWDSREIETSGSFGGDLSFVDLDGDGIDEIVRSTGRGIAYYRWTGTSFEPVHIRSSRLWEKLGGFWYSSTGAYMRIYTSDGRSSGHLYVYGEKYKETGRMKGGSGTGNGHVVEQIIEVSFSLPSETGTFPFSYKSKSGIWISGLYDARTDTAKVWDSYGWKADWHRKR